MTRLSVSTQYLKIKCVLRTKWKWKIWSGSFFQVTALPYHRISGNFLVYALGPWILSSGQRCQWWQTPQLFWFSPWVKEYWSFFFGFPSSWTSKYWPLFLFSSNYFYTHLFISIMLHFWSYRFLFHVSDAFMLPS